MSLVSRPLLNLRFVVYETVLWLSIGALNLSHKCHKTSNINIIHVHVVTKKTFCFKMSRVVHSSIVIDLI